MSSYCQFVLERGILIPIGITVKKKFVFNIKSLFLFNEGVAPEQAVLFDRDEHHFGNISKL